MNLNLHRPAVLLAAAVMLPLLPGCGSTKPSSFYMLRPMPEALQPAGAGADLALGVGPIEVAPHLARPQIATGRGGTTLHYAEYNRWAEPLDQNINEVLDQNLSALLGTERVIQFPWTDVMPVDYWITVQVLRLEGEPGDTVFLDARWLVYGKDRDAPLALRLTHYTEPCLGNSFEALVDAKSRLLAELSKDIAREIERLEKEKQEAPAS